MRKMLSAAKRDLLNNQVRDNAGTIVDENDREFNGDVEFTGNVVLNKIYGHKITLKKTSSSASDVIFNVYTTTAGEYQDLAGLLSDINNVISVQVDKLSADGSQVDIVVYQGSTRLAIVDNTGTLTRYTTVHEFSDVVSVIM